MNHLSKTRLSVYRGLGSAKMRRRKCLFAVEGEKCVADTMRGFPLEALLVREGMEIPLTLAEKAGPEKIFLVSGREMADLSEFVTPSEVMGIFRLPEEVEYDGGKLDSSRLYLALDGVRDPGNFGSIMRTADWFGIHTIFASRDCADMFNPKVLQAAMGSAANVNVFYTDLPEIIEANNHMPVIGTLLEGKDIYDAALPEGGMIVMGNEGKGLSEDVRRLVTLPLLIPPFDSIHGESLNVGAATAAVLVLFRAAQACKK